MEFKKSEVAVLSIATNGYLTYYENLIDSYSKICRTEKFIEFHVFTDDPHRARILTTRHPEIKIVIHQIPAYVWPEATLLRYQIYLRDINQIPAKYFMHLDADMLFMEDIFKDKDEIFKDDAMTLILHPGFYRERNQKLRIWLRFNFRQPIGDLVRRIRLGALGAWETNRKSTAFTPRVLRKSYYCGGVWLGPATQFISFLKVNSENILTDLEKGYIAQWHDESHLNKWATGNQFFELNPGYCFDNSYPQLQQIKGKIEAVNKQETMTAEIKS
jgi:hypothetical protein